LSRTRSHKFSARSQSSASFSQNAFIDLHSFPVAPAAGKSRCWVVAADRNPYSRT
jgi:hypothetical protein